MTLIIFLLMVGSIAYRAMTPDQRTRAVRTTVTAIGRMKDYGQKEVEPFRETLRVRTSWVAVTPALVVLNVAIFLGTLSATGAQRDPATLIGWGASFGPLTSNGEWWRLLTAMLVHRGLPSLIINTATLVQIGLLLERLVGRFAFLIAYIAAGVFAGLASLVTDPTSVSAGASGAVFGLYGLLVASLVAGWRRRSGLRIPLVALTRFVPVTAIFVLYNLAGQSLGARANFTALMTGLAFGLMVTRDVGDRTPPPRRIAFALAVGLTIAVGSAISLRGIADVWPELHRLVGIEHRTSEAYQAAVEQFKKGRMTAEELADLIDHAIVPELQAAGVRISTLHGVPREDERRMADAKEYVQLRSESWHFRAEGLRLSNRPVPAASMVAQNSAESFSARAESRHWSMQRAFGKAEGAERASLDALNRLQQQ